MALAAGILVALGLSALAFEDLPVPTTRVEFVSSPDDKLVLDLQYRQASPHDYSTNQLSGVRLLWRGKSITIPQEHLEGLFRVQLDSVVIRDGYYPTPPHEEYRYVTMQCGELVGPDSGRYVIVTFNFCNYEYVGMQVYIPFSGTYTRGRGRAYFTADGLGDDSTNAVAQTISELVEQMLKRQAEHLDLIRQWEKDRVGGAAKQ